MKIELLKDHYLNGNLLRQGAQIEIEDGLAKSWIAEKWAKPLAHPQSETAAATATECPEPNPNPQTK